MFQVFVCISLALFASCVSAGFIGGGAGAPGGFGGYNYDSPAPSGPAEFAAPAPEYSAPAPEFHAPEPQYSAPAPEYHAPAQVVKIVQEHHGKISFHFLFVLRIDGHSE